MIDDIDLGIFGTAVTEWAVAEDKYYTTGVAIRSEFEHWTEEEVIRALNRTHRIDYSFPFLPELKG